MLRYKEVRAVDDSSWVDNSDDEVIAGFDKGAWFLEETQQQRGALTQILVEIEQKYVDVYGMSSNEMMAAQVDMGEEEGDA